MNECLTKPLLSNSSGCLVENPDCRYAVSIGFSYLCSHPDHKSFQGRPAAELSMHYVKLRESRRNAYFDRLVQAYKHDPALVDLLNYVNHPTQSR